MTNRERRSTLAAVLAAASLLGLAGCAPTGAKLEGTRWRLAAWTLSSLAPGDVAITAEFRDGRIGGRSGVNTYGGPYVAGPGDAFRAGPLMGTLMAGPEPAMRAERAFLDLLGQARSCRIEDGQLTLCDEGGGESLVFEAAGE